MNGPKKDVKELEEVISLGDSWLRRYGIVSPFAHNSIILNLRVQFPNIQHIEYLIDSEERSLELTLSLSRRSLFWMTITRRRDDFIDDIISFLNEYLYQYEISVKLVPFKRAK